MWWSHDLYWVFYLWITCVEASGSETYGSHVVPHGWGKFMTDSEFCISHFTLFFYLISMIFLWWWHVHSMHLCILMMIMMMMWPTSVGTMRPSLMGWDPLWRHPPRVGLSGCRRVSTQAIPVFAMRWDEHIDMKGILFILCANWWMMFNDVLVFWFM
jgi:hypothetical protein